jgi:hypothetical protein
MQLSKTTFLAFVATASAQQQPPHLSHAWVAQSTGDGLPNSIGTESYLFEDCKERSDNCVNGHIFDYGASCTKYEIDRGYGSKFSGTFYVKCKGGLNCCMKEKAGPQKIPKVKKWDIGQAGALLHDKITYLGKRDTTELNNNPVKGADAWFETFDLPFSNTPINYTYFITENGTDVITHRIDFGAPGKGATGSILYGNFQNVHNVTAFRDVFQPPAACLQHNVMKCPKESVDEWEEAYFRRH